MIHLERRAAFVRKSRSSRGQGRVSPHMKIEATGGYWLQLAACDFVINHETQHKRV
jgi:hypothetical protein